MKRNILKNAQYIVPVICLIVLVTAIVVTSVPVSHTNKNVSAVTNPLSKSADVLRDLPELTAKHCIVTEFDTGRILYEKNAFNKSAMASTTKIMTALIVIENCRLDDYAVVSQNAAAIGGSEINLKAGEEISVEHLLYGLMLESGNDAAIALAEHTSGQIRDFCTLMNERATAIGAVNTNFTSPHGLDNPEHYTTAYDLSLITKEAMKNETFCKIVATKNYTAGSRHFTNTNALLGTVEGVDGGKTGFTNNAGRCIVLTAKRNGMRIIAVIFGCPDTLSRTIDGKRIIECIYDNYRMYNILPTSYKAVSIDIKKSKTKPSDLITTQEIKLPLTEDEYNQLSFSCEVFGKHYDLNNSNEPSDLIILSENNSFANTVCGMLFVSVNGNILYKCDLIHTSDVIKKTFGDYLIETLKTFATVLC